MKTNRDGERKERLDQREKGRERDRQADRQTERAREARLTKNNLIASRTPKRTEFRSKHNILYYRVYRSNSYFIQSKDR